MDEKAIILIIDDSEAVRKKVRDALHQARLVEFCFEAKSGLEGFKLLMEKKVDLVICDVIMPEFDGFKFLISKATRPEFENIPVIMLTSEGDVTQKIRGLEQGASDYVLKPFAEGELTARVKVHLKVKFLQDQLRQKNADLQELVGTDSLTRINNRRRFMEYLEKEFFRAQRYKQSFALGIFDIDFFKQVNDRFGHLAGDAVLVQIAAVIGQSIRSSDMVGRYGGDELVLLLPNADLRAAISFAERIRKQVEVMEFSGAEQSLKLTVSGGVASYPEVAASSIDELLRKADEALYRAKAKGRNRVEAVSPR